MILRELLCRVKVVAKGRPQVMVNCNSKMCMKTSGYYEEAVKTLNSLQTNASVLQEMKKRNRAHSSQVKNVEETVKYLLRSGISQEKLGELSVIHVSGTKGKGSTCAYCESILRYHGYKTGFYSSPHLVAVRERIRINGQPLNQHDFTKHFWKVYQKLSVQKEHENDMPPYFKFLTVMALNVFLAEKVDVAIIEVGIGGEYDCTNIFRYVPVVGITSLGIDHTNLLGNTIEEIAWQKAGIMKPESTAITVCYQPKSAVKVLKDRAFERKSTLLLAPPLDSYDWDLFTPELNKLPDVQLLNASLAIQLAKTWMQQNQKGITDTNDYENVKSKKANGFQLEEQSPEIPLAPLFPITLRVARGLKYCTWPGRNQIINEGSIQYFLDGAHTKESLELCADWFVRNSKTVAKSDIPHRVLIFNCTGNRNSKTLLSPLTDCDFQLVIFCPNNVTTTSDSASDQANFTVSESQQLERCRKNEGAWQELVGDKLLKINPGIKFSHCVLDALTYVQKHSVDEGLEVHVLVTGSLHLVGSVLSVLDPDLKKATSQLSDVDAGLESENIIQTYNS